MTNAELVILSLIAERPRHGYEIEVVIEDRGEWLVTFICADDRLLAVAQSEGLPTDNPNHHA